MAHTLHGIHTGPAHPVHVLSLLPAIELPSKFSFTVCGDQGFAYNLDANPKVASYVGGCILMPSSSLLVYTHFLHLLYITSLLINKVSRVYSDLLPGGIQPLSPEGVHPILNSESNLEFLRYYAVHNLP